MKSVNTESDVLAALLLHYHIKKDGLNLFVWNDLSHDYYSFCKCNNLTAKKKSHMVGATFMRSCLYDACV